MNVTVSTPYGHLVLTSLFRRGPNNPYDHCCLSGGFVLNFRSYSAALNMMRAPGKLTWQVVDMTQNEALPRPWNISLYPRDKIVAATPLDLDEHDVIQLNCSQLVASVFATVFREMNIIERAPAAASWIELDANLETELRRYRFFGSSEERDKAARQSNALVPKAEHISPSAEPETLEQRRLSGG